MWSLFGQVLPKLMSFPKVWRLHVSPVPSFFHFTLTTAHGINDHSGSVELDINLARLLLLLLCDFYCVCTRLWMHVSVSTQVVFDPHLGVCMFCCFQWIFPPNARWASCKNIFVVLNCSYTSIPNHIQQTFLTDKLVPNNSFQLDECHLFQVLLLLLVPMVVS